MTDKKNDGGSGFERLGVHKKNAVRDSVVPFDADRVNEAMKKAALRLEHERRQRTQVRQDNGPFAEPSPEDIDPLADEKLEETKGCDQQLAVEIQSALMAQGLILRDCIMFLKNDASEEMVKESAEYVRAFAMAFKALDRRRKNNDSPIG